MFVRYIIFNIEYYSKGDAILPIININFQFQVYIIHPTAWWHPYLLNYLCVPSIDVVLSAAICRPFPSHGEDKNEVEVLDYDWICWCLYDVILSGWVFYWIGLHADYVDYVVPLREYGSMQIVYQLPDNHRSSFPATVETYNLLLFTMMWSTALCSQMTRNAASIIFSICLALFTEYSTETSYVIQHIMRT